MNEQLISGHTLEDFDLELNQLNELIFRAVDKARKHLAKAVKSLKKEDIDLAHNVIERDKKINNLELEVDEKVFEIIALRQPVAKDLRILLAVDKMMQEIERIGDEASNLARLTLVLYDGDNNNPPNHNLLSDIPKLVKFVDGMLATAIQAFKEDDARIALEVLHQKGELENEMKAALRRLSTYLLDDARRVGQFVEISLSLRGVDRIGRRAAYIARHVIFLITGNDVRHEDLKEVERVVGEYYQE